MGVVNVTPDSFSDGGKFLDPELALAHARSLISAGADLVDIGGESTRPGAQPVSEAQECERVMPVVRGLAETRDAVISVDTTKLGVGLASLQAGAEVINDVSAFRFSPELAGAVADAGAYCCLCHMLGDPRTMQHNPTYDDVVCEVKRFLEERLSFAVQEGVKEDNVWLDPGIGFGKTIAHNLELLRRLDELAAIGRPLVVGTSRKAFIGKITGRPESDRVAGTLAANVLAYERGASIFRVHDVADARCGLDLAGAALTATWPALEETQILPSDRTGIDNRS
jgi:dihydropteroate synthase